MGFFVVVGIKASHLLIFVVVYVFVCRFVYVCACM